MSVDAEKLARAREIFEAVDAGPNTGGEPGKARLFSVYRTVCGQRLCVWAGARDTPDDALLEALANLEAYRAWFEEGSAYGRRSRI